MNKFTLVLAAAVLAMFLWPRLRRGIWALPLAVGWSRGGASSGRAGRRRVAAGGPVAGGVFCRMLPCMGFIRGGMT